MSIKTLRTLYLAALVLIIVGLVFMVMGRPSAASLPSSVAPGTNTPTIDLVLIGAVLGLVACAIALIGLLIYLKTNSAKASR